MLKILISLFLFVNISFSNNSKVLSAYVVSIYDSNFNEEKLQGKRETSKNYKNLTYTKIHTFGNLYHEELKVRIGTSIGHLYNSKHIVKNKLIIGKELIYKHYTVSSGFIKVGTSNKVYDMSVFVK